MMVSVAAPSRMCTSSSPFRWRSQGLSPEKLPAKILPSRNGASTANAPFASASVVSWSRPRNTGRPASSALMSTALSIPLSFRIALGAGALLLNYRQQIGIAEEHPRPVLLLEDGQGMAGALDRSAALARRDDHGELGPGVRPVSGHLDLL